MEDSKYGNYHVEIVNFIKRNAHWVLSYKNM